MLAEGRHVGRVITWEGEYEEKVRTRGGIARGESKQVGKISTWTGWLKTCQRVDEQGIVQRFERNPKVTIPYHLPLPLFSALQSANRFKTMEALPTLATMCN